MFAASNFKLSRRHLLTASLCATSLTSLVAPAFAQEAAQETEQAETDAQIRTGEIVVTARRKDEILQDVPVAITAFSQASLNERVITTSYDLAKSTPGLVVNASSGNASLPDFSIRGRGQFFGAASGSVETYFAEVPLSPPFQIPTLPPQYFDLASVQVLKGPQGTLFGRNTTGGAVLFVPQAPTDEFEGYVRGQLGTLNNRQIEAALNIPLGDIGALRLAGFGWHRQGYTRTLGGELDFTNFRPLPVQFYNNQDVVQLRGTLRLNLSDSIENTTLFTWHTDKNRSSSQVIAGRAGTAFGAAVAGSITGNPRISSLDTNLDRKASSTFGLINTTTIDLTESVRLKNIFSYIWAKGYGNNPSDVDGAAVPAINIVRPLRQLRNRQLVNELQLQGSIADDRLEWIIGGVYDQTRQPGANDSINIVTNTFGFSAAGPDYDVQFRQSRFTSHSFFGSLTFNATDRLSFTAAARRIIDKIGDRSLQINNSPVPLAGIPNLAALPPGVTALDQTASRTFKGWSYNVGADYEVADGTMVYAGYRRGYKRGGFNGRGAGLNEFGPETVDNFYAGLKADFTIAGANARFNIEGFWDNYQNAQRSYLDLFGGALVTTIENVPKSRYRGFDTDLIVNPADWLRISANYTYVDAEYLRFPDNTVATALALLPPAFRPGFLAANPLDNNSLAVNPPGYVNKHKLNVQARFNAQFDDGSEIALIPALTYQSEFFFNDNSARLQAVQQVLFNGGAPVNAIADGANTAPGYTTVDLRAEFNRIGGRDLTFALGATNLTNKAFVLGGGGIWAFGVDAVVYGAPRLFYAEMRLGF